MEILWAVPDRQPRLRRWEKRSFWPGMDEGPTRGDRHDTYRREVASEKPGEPEPDGPYRHLARAITAYRIFPSWLVTGVLRRRPVAPGDTVGIRYHFPGGLSLFFGARVVACFDGPAGATWKTGFTYRTLRGHPVIGEETFTVAKDVPTGRVWVELRSWSRPGTLLARALTPLLRLFQAHASQAALDNLAGMAQPLSTEFR